MKAFQARQAAEKKDADDTFTDGFLEKMGAGELSPAETLSPAEKKIAYRLGLYLPAMEKYIARQQGKTIPMNLAAVRRVQELQNTGRLHTLDIRHPALIEALGVAYTDFKIAYTREMALRTGVKTALAKLSTAEIKKSQDIETIMRFGKPKFAAEDFSNQEMWDVRVGIGRLLAGLDKDQLLDPDAIASIIDDAIEEVTHVGSGWIYDNTMSASEAATKRAISGNVIITDPAEFDGRTAERFAIPEQFVTISRRERRRLNMPVTGVLIRQDYRKAVRQQKKATADAQVRRGPPQDHVDAGAEGCNGHT